METETRLNPCRPQPIRSPLPFKIIYSNIVELSLYSIPFRNFEARTILVYTIINGKGGQLLVDIVTVLFALFLTGQSNNSCLLSSKIFCVLLSRFSFFLLLLFLNIIVEKWRTASSVS